MQLQMCILYARSYTHTYIKYIEPIVPQTRHINLVVCVRICVAPYQIMLLEIYYWIKSLFSCFAGIFDADGK